jgi:hypothetical protein
MDIKIGRNDLCHCGSGKKYKKCCLMAAQAAAQAAEGARVIIDAKWRRLRQLEDIVLEERLFDYLMKEVSKKVVNAAKDEFSLHELPEDMDVDQVNEQIFWPWFLFHWVPSRDLKVKNFCSDMTVAQNYVKAHRDAISDEELSFIEAAVNSHFSFYCVLDVEFGQSLFVKDILLGTTHTLMEMRGTLTCKRGDIFFTRILPIEDISICISVAPYVVPAKYHTDIIDFRDMLMKGFSAKKALSSEVLRGGAGFFVLDFYFRLMSAAFNPSLPTLMNTDEELVVFVELHFELSMELEEAASCLAPLSRVMKLADILKSAERSQSGEIKKIAFSWEKKGNKKHRSWSNTVLGDIEMVKGTLVLNVNSQERAERGRALLQECLGDKISFNKAIVKTQEQQYQEFEQSQSKGEEPQEQSMQELNESEEAQEIIRDMTKAHWEDWLSVPIPALKGKTPLQAARSKSGRERLEALLLECERNAVGKNNVAGPDIAYMRKRLRLDSE